MLEKIFHLIAAGLVLMLCVMCLPVYLPQAVTQIGWDLSTFCHRISEVAYPVFFSIVVFAESGILATLFVRGRKRGHNA